MPFGLLVFFVAFVLFVGLLRYNRMTVSAQQKSEPFAVPDPSTLKPPCEDPITVSELSQFDGRDGGPIYVAIKGVVFDVSAKREMYGPGKSYNVFAGKDASCALGRSSLKKEDAHADYSQLNSEELKVLNDWDLFFRKRYNIVGKVVSDK